jgi:type VI secretion system protein ImpL
MKETYKKVIKVFLLVSAVTLLLLLICGVVLVLDWPWWVGLFLALLLAGFVLAIVFIRKIMLRRREQNFVREISEEDEARVKALSSFERSEARELQERWKNAVETLRKSHLKKLGNPLYVLPWYMVIGESGSGKTTSLNSARLASPFTGAGRVQGVSGTRQCDWWFFEQAVVIDTAGRYAIPVNEAQDKDEWQKFLGLLIKYRRREPLNGLIVTVAADGLLKADAEELERNGRTIRGRVDELMRALGMRFPVYLLVTKCDLVQGVNRFCELLPEKSLNQAMGIINHDLSPDVDSFVEHAVTTIDERLRNLRLQLLHQPEAKDPDPALLLFPEEFERLKDGLAFFIRGAFRTNPYQETPVLRGIFFSSGRQEGNTLSHFTRAVGDMAESEALPGTSKGLFLHDFFGRILPLDRSLLSPTRRALQWRSFTGSLGLTSWIILGIAFCGLLSFSFVKNLKTIRDISQEFTKPPSVQGETITDPSALDRFRREILVVEERNRHWWFPRFGLTESLTVEAAVKERYCTRFRDGLLAPFDRKITDAVTSVSPATGDVVYGDYVVHLARRVNILASRLKGVDPEALRKMPQPDYLFFDSVGNPADDRDARRMFGPLYLSYLDWRTDPAAIAGEMGQLRSLLTRLFAARDDGLRWMTAWINARGALPGVTLAEFWGGSLNVAGEKSIPPAYTRKGKGAIDSLMKELEAALENPGVLTGRQPGFNEWYRGSSFAAWQGFAADFPRGAERLNGVVEWRQAASRMASEQGPYFALVNRIAVELQPLAVDTSMPPWLRQIYQFQRVRIQGAVQASNPLVRSGQGGRRILAGIRRSIGREAAARKIESKIALSASFQRYRDSLAAVSAATASRNLAFQLATQTFGEDPAAGKSPVYLAANAATELKASAASGGAPDGVFGQLVTGPLDFLWTFIRRESACQLQSLWEEQVLAGTMGMSPQQVLPYLAGPDGPAWRFVKGPAAPFVAPHPSGYRARVAFGGAIPIDNALFGFMSKGAKAQATVMEAGKQQNLNVGIKGLPTDANAEATIKPHATRLEVQCGGNNQILINNNYPVGKTFTWSPESCGDVIFQIEVGDVTLTRHYSGADAFSDFLKDMRGGRRTFSVREFPGERAALERMGITSMTVNYRFIGSGSVLRRTAAVTGQAPRSIAKCWAR